MRKVLLSLFIAFGLLGLAALPTPIVSAADVLNPACDDGLMDPATGQLPVACQNNVNQPTSGNAIYGPDGLLTKAASLMAVLVGVAAVIMIIIGGFKYVTASGDPSNVKSAKDTVLFAVVGLLVAASTQSIVVLVLSRL